MNRTGFYSGAILHADGWKLLFIFQSLLAACGVKVIHVLEKNPTQSPHPSLFSYFLPGLMFDISSSRLQGQLERTGTAAVAGPKSPAFILEKHLRYFMPDQPVSWTKLTEDLRHLFPEGLKGLASLFPFPHLLSPLVHEKIPIRDFTKKGLPSWDMFPVLFTDDIHQPLGRFFGLACELREIRKTLTAEGALELLKLSFELAVEILLMSGKAQDRNGAKNKLKNALTSGKALDSFDQLFLDQGADPVYFQNLFFSENRPVKILRSKKQGFLQSIRNDILLEVRKKMYERASLPSNFDGVGLLKKTGDWISEGDPMLQIHGQFLTISGFSEKNLKDMFRIGPKCPAFKPLIVQKTVFGPAKNPEIL
ncbi:MAG: hypothetical protein JXB26_05655 [Candidatus Aminicenantes bacterium]|nr:hypothetical protein [Candidatus Aminicenantes bacterium]